jgi:hypothetical protein
MGIREDHLHRHGRRTHILHGGRTEPLEAFFFCCNFGDIRRRWQTQNAPGTKDGQEVAQNACCRQGELTGTDRLYDIWAMGDSGTSTGEERALPLVLGDQNCVRRQQVKAIVCAMEIRPELRKFLDARIGCFGPGRAHPQIPNTIPESSPWRLPMPGLS